MKLIRTIASVCMWLGNSEKVEKFFKSKDGKKLNTLCIILIVQGIVYGIADALGYKATVDTVNEWMIIVAMVHALGLHVWQFFKAQNVEVEVVE